MEDIKLEKKLKEIDMTKEEYIKHISILDFYQFVKSQKETILDTPIQDYMSNITQFIAKKVLIYGEDYKKYFEEYSAEYLKHMQDEVNETLGDIDKEIKNIVKKVNEDYVKLEKLNNDDERIEFTKLEIQKLEDKNFTQALMYTELLKIRYSIGGDLQEDMVKIFKT